MPALHHRSDHVEIMDDLSCEGEVVDQTLRELDFINKWLGGNVVTLAPLNAFLKKLPAQTLTIADLGCGSGEMLRLVARSKQAAPHQLRLTGVDANPNIVQFARQHSLGFENVSFEAWNVFSDEFGKKKFDMVLATLFLHHFSHTELVKLMTVLHTNTRHLIIVNDLHRHTLAYYSIRWLTQLFSRSAMVKFDAPLSVARGFRKQEWLAILKEAGITRFELRWRWAFRWQLIISPAGK